MTRAKEDRPSVVMELEEGENAHAILSRFKKAARKQGWEKEEIEEVLEEAKSGDYEYLIETIREQLLWEDE